MSAATLTLPSEQAVWRPKVNPWAIAATVSMAAFIEVLDTSVANVALPYIAGGPQSQLRRQHLGTHLVPRCEKRHRLTHQRMARGVDHAQAVLHDVACDFHVKFTALRG